MCAKAFVSLIVVCSLLSASFGQSGSSPAQATQTQLSPTPSSIANIKGFVLEDGTPIKLRLNRNVSSMDAHIGDSVDFEVLEEIAVNGVRVIPKGSLALGTVTEAQPKRRMARGGKLDMNIDSVRLGDGERAALRAVKEAKGGGHTGAMTAGIVATGLILWPAAPFFLFMHGKDVTVPKGAELTAYVSGDMKLDIAKFQQSSPSRASEQSPLPSNTSQVLNSSSTKLQMESNPSGADIELDGSFVGNTPSDVQVSEGEHTISLKKTGFKNWERKLKVSASSSIHLSAEMERVDTP